MVVLIGGKAKDEANKKLIANLGGKALEDIDSTPFDVYVCDPKLIRNCKLLLALALGAAIVSPQWLKDSGKKGKFISGEQLEGYKIFDKEFEKTHKCKLK